MAMDSDKSSENDFEVLEKQGKINVQPNLLINVNGEIELKESLDSAIKETDSRVTTPNTIDGLSSPTVSYIDNQDEAGVIYNKVVYLGAANISSPKSEMEIQKNIAFMRQQCVISSPIPVMILVPRSSDGSVVLYDDSTQAELARYPISRILYFARGASGSPENSCFAFNCAHGGSHNSALFQSHVFRCDVPEAIGKVSTSFVQAFKKHKVQSPENNITYIAGSTPSAVVFEVTLEIREADSKGNYNSVPKDKNFFKVRSNVEKQVVITVLQISDNIVLDIERCFGILISAGKAVKKSDVHLLGMVSMGTVINDGKAVYTITGSWDPGDPAFSQLNKETPKDTDRVYMTVAVDLVISGIREPVRFDIETKLKVFPQSEKFWYISRKHHFEHFTLILSQVFEGDEKHYDVTSVESSGEIEKPPKSLGLTLNLASLGLNSSTLVNLPSISPLTNLDTPKDEDISDNDEPLLSGSGDVSKECSESELESWAQVLDAWKENSHVLPKQLHSLIKGGIPEALRGEIWLRLVGCFDQSELMDSYRILITKECSAEEVILRDLHRTFPAHDYFKENGGHGQDALAKIVKAYSIYDEEIGYCQGITFIAAALLLHMPEEQAFCVLVKIMSEYGLRDLFKDGLEALHLRFFQLDKLLEEQLPEVYSHFSDQRVETHMYASQWFLTLFTAKFPLYLVFRIVDLFLYARMDTVFQIAMALLSVSKKDLLQLSFENILKYFRVQLPKRFRSEESARHLMRVASGIKVKKLGRYEKEFYEYKALSEDPLTKLEKEKAKLQKSVLRLEHENDSLAHELINVKLKLRAELDEAERKLDTFSRELQSSRRSLKEVEEDKKCLEAESSQVKDMLKREIAKNEAESQRNTVIITEYKKICTQLSEQLEEGRKIVEEAAKINTKERFDACQCQPQQRKASDSEVVSLANLQKHNRELELELAQTKLALVESQCKNQDLSHQAIALTSELQASKSGWFQKTITSLKEAAKTQPILNQPKAGNTFQRKDSLRDML